jgi:hypothetical protein
MSGGARFELNQLLHWRGTSRANVEYGPKRPFALAIVSQQTLQVWRLSGLFSFALFVHDLANGAGASAALRLMTEAAIDLRSTTARRLLTYQATDIVISNHVA